MTSNLLPRGVLAPVRSNVDPTYTPSPSEDLHLTVKKVLDANSRLQEKVEELEGDKRHFQRKLDEYIRSDMEDKTGNSHTTSNTVVLEKEVEYLKRENSRLNSLLMTTEKERRGGGLTSGNSRFSEREYNPVLLHQLSELQAARSLCIDQHEKKMEVMKLESFRQREEIERLKRTIQFTESIGLQNRRSSWDTINGHSHLHGESGHTSLPESLSSFSSSTSRKTEVTGASGLTLSTVNSSSLSSNSADLESTTVAELKKLKKQLDKYKTANIELDQRLKDANLELQSYTERRGNWDATHRMDTERLNSEVYHLRAQLDRALSENSQLRSLAGRQMY